MGTALRLRPPEGSNLGTPQKNALKQYNFFYKKCGNTERDANLECIPNSTTYLPGTSGTATGFQFEPQIWTLINPKFWLYKSTDFKNSSRFVLDESIENVLHGYRPLVAPAGRFELRYPPKKCLKQYNLFYKKIENTKRDANLECIPNSTTYLTQDLWHRHWVPVRTPNLDINKSQILT